MLKFDKFAHAQLLISRVSKSLKTGSSSFPAVGPEQPVDPDVPGVQAVPPEDPQPERQPHLGHGGSQGAQAPHMAQLGQ